MEAPSGLGGGTSDPGRYISCPNVPRNIAIIVGRKPPLATLHDLDTIYGLEDLHDMLEIMAVESINQDIADVQARIEAKIAAMQAASEGRR